MIAFFMGLIQGITEFLPISSSGHLQLFVNWFASNHSVPSLFGVILHIATLIAVLFFTRRFLKQFLLSFFKIICTKADLQDRKNMRIVWYILVSTLATAPLAFLMRFILHRYEWWFNSQIIAYCFLFTAVMLILPSINTLPIFIRRNTKINNTKIVNTDESNNLNNITLGMALFIGIMQGITVLPGISRSGITISVALLLGLRRSEASYFSFLISIPTIIVSFLFSMNELQYVSDAFYLWEIMLGMMVALISGLLMLYVLHYIVRKGRLWIFSFYLVPLAVSIFIYQLYQ